MFGYHNNLYIKMEEIVALDSKKQKKFVKSIKGIKKLIKKNEGKQEVPKKEEKVEPQKPFSMRLNTGTVQQQHKKRKERGLVYLAHIPHGFYEHQMTQYFKQFGVVTNARVIKSKRTGNSKGFAFVEFKEPAVGQIVAETMNNYLMGKRLIKAVYIPPEKQKHHAFRKHWNAINNPSSQARLKIKKAINADKDEKADLQKAKKLLANLSKTKKRLSELGINYDFFSPVDVPEALLNKPVKEEKDEKDTKTSKSKASKEVKVEEVTNKKVENKLTKNGPAEPDNKNALVLFNKEKGQTKNSKPKLTRRQSVSGGDDKEFIKIAESESDDSYVFDPEEFKRQQEYEAKYEITHMSSKPDDSTSDDSSDVFNDSGSLKIPPRKIIKGKVQKKAKAIADKPKEEPQKSQKKNVPQNKPQEVKRKAAQKSAVTAKKPKFEKQNQKQTQKSFKKK